MKRRLLKVVEHDPDTNKDELEYRKILMEFQKKSKECENNDNVGDMLSKFGLDENYKIISPKYGVVYTKIKYGLFIIFGFILSLIYQTNMKYINPYLKKTGVYAGEEDIPVIIHFLSLSLTLFFGFHALLCSPLMGSKHRNKNDYQNKYFLAFKIPLFIVCLVAPYFIVPEFVINIHVFVSKYVMFFYMFLSSIFIIDFAYRWSRAWHDEDDWRWDTCLISISCVFIILALAIYGVSFFNSGFKNSGCLLNFYVTAFACLLSLILLISSLFTEHASLFSGSMITLYMAVTLLNVLMSKPMPEKQCQFTNTYPVTIGAMVFALFSILYSAIYSTTGLQFLAHFLWYGEEPEEDDDHDFVKDDKALNNSYFFYHSFLTVCSFYLTTFFQQYKGWNELGIQAFLLLFTMALYGWSLLAPYVLYWRRFD